MIKVLNLRPLCALLYSVFAIAAFTAVVPVSQGATPALPPIITAPTSVNNVPGAPQVTYAASFSGLPPTLDQGELVSAESWHWTDNCSPQDGSGNVSVTYNASSAGSFTSTVGCSVLWTIASRVTGKITRTVLQKGEATTTVNFGGIWSPGVKSGGVMMSPQDQSASPASPSVVIASPGSSLHCSLSGVTASDQFTFAGQTITVPADVKYSWTCTDGSFSKGRKQVTTSTAQQPIWYAPTVDEMKAGVTATITATATSSGAIQPYDTGSRGSQPIKDTVTAYVPLIWVLGGQFGPANVYVGQDVTANVKAELTPSIPGVTDNVIWSSNVLWYSRTGAAGTFRPYFGDNSFTSTSTTLDGIFSGHYIDAGYYILEVDAQDTLKDSSNNTLGKVSGFGLINGSWSFIVGNFKTDVTTGTAGIDPSWYLQQWTENNKPYNDARSEVEQTAQVSVTKAALQYWAKEKDEAAPSALDVYRAGYAIWLESSTPPSSEFYVSPKQIASDIEHVSGSHAGADYHSSEFARMRFLFESQYDPKPWTLAAGNRLLSLNPNDAEVIAGELRVLNIGVNPVDTQRAIDLCQQLIKLQPKSAATYKVVASVYFIAYAWTENTDYRQLTIDNLKTFLLYAATDDPFVSFAKDRVTQLSEQL